MCEVLMKKQSVGFFSFRGQWAISPRMTVAHAVLFTVGVVGFVWYIVEFGMAADAQKTYAATESIRAGIAGTVWVVPMFTDLIIFGWLRVMSLPKDASTP